MFKYTYRVIKQSATDSTINQETLAIFIAYREAGKILDNNETYSVQEDGSLVCDGTINFLDEATFNEYKAELAALSSVYADTTTVISE